MPPHDVYVSFDPVVDEQATLHQGTYQTNPNYGHDRADSNDVAVVLIDEEVTSIAPARLPTAGLLDQMKDNGALKRQLFTAVGYGVLRDDKTGGPHSLATPDERFYAIQSFLSLQPAWVQLSMNPSTGSGGTCYGDSGGPHFLGESDIVMSVTVTGDAPCRAMDTTYRVDTPTSRWFLGQFVTLP